MDNKNLKNNVQASQPVMVKTVAKENKNAAKSNLWLYEKVHSVPDSALKKIEGGALGAAGFFDISPMWRIKVLTENFGLCGIGWKFTLVNKSIDMLVGVQVAHVEINLFIKDSDTKTWSDPIIGIGGTKLNKMSADEAYKMALTDAISVACKALCIGADVYMGLCDDKYKYQNMQAQNQAPVIENADDQLNAALQEINSAQSMDSLNTIYSHYTMYQNNGLFLNSLREKSAQFKTN